MGEWYKVEPKPYSPCDSCQAGACGISQKIVDGVLYQKTDDCHETCEIYRDYLNSDKEHFFGDNIRDAIRTIKGKEPLIVDTSYVLTPSGYKKRTFI